MAEKTMAEILAAAKKAKTTVEGDKYENSSEYFDPNNLTLEQKLKLRKAANNPKDPNYQAWLQINAERQSSGWVKIDLSQVKNLTEDDQKDKDK